MVTTLPDIGAASRSRSRKVYVTGSRDDLRVPFREVEQSPTPAEYGVEDNAPLRLYDTSGFHTDPLLPVDVREGLPALRRHWVIERGDVEEYEGRTSGWSTPGFAGARAKPLRAREGAAVTQMAYARRGMITPEMEFCALREGVSPEFI